MPPRKVPTQPGFLLLGIALLVPAYLAGTLLVQEWPRPLHRLVFAVVAVLSLLAIEALWWVRPWVSRAVDAWAVACVAAVLAADLTMVGGFVVPALFLTGLSVAVPCGVASRYVRGRARRLGLA